MLRIQQLINRRKTQNNNTRCKPHNPILNNRSTSAEASGASGDSTLLEHCLTRFTLTAQRRSQNHAHQHLACTYETGTLHLRVVEHHDAHATGIGQLCRTFLVQRHLRSKSAAKHPKKAASHGKHQFACHLKHADPMEGQSNSPSASLHTRKRMVHRVETGRRVVRHRHVCQSSSPLPFNFDFRTNAIPNSQHTWELNEHSIRGGLSILSSQHLPSMQ